jgi:uncharacterized protein with HEPN domain
MRKPIGNRQRLLHILQANKEIESYIKDVDREIFLSHSMMKYACAKQIEIIGEAANYLTAEFKMKFPQVEWGEIAGMRNILVHEYFGIDFNILWQVISEDIPALKKKIESLPLV